LKPRIPYTKPSITELEVRYATDAAAKGWGERCYAYIERFENSFKEHLGVKHAIITSVAPSYPNSPRVRPCRPEGRPEWTRHRLRLRFADVPRDLRPPIQIAVRRHRDQQLVLDALVDLKLRVCLEVFVHGGLRVVAGGPKGGRETCRQAPGASVAIPSSGDITRRPVAGANLLHLAGLILIRTFTGSPQRSRNGE
jgi:hypothetical protein